MAGIAAPLIMASLIMAAAPVVAADFTGKTITILLETLREAVVMFTDASSRDTLAKYPGTPNVIVINKGGGGGTTALNRV